MIYGVDLKKVDTQGRLILPTDWRKAEIGPSREVFVVKRKGFLKLIPKQSIDLTEDFDSIDLGVEAIGDWREFERKLTEGKG